MSLWQDVTESEIAKDGNMPCGICPEGIADKAFPPDSTARRRCFYATVRVILSSYVPVHCKRIPNKSSARCCNGAGRVTLQNGFAPASLGSITESLLYAPTVRSASAPYPEHWF